MHLCRRPRVAVVTPDRLPTTVNFPGPQAAVLHFADGMTLPAVLIRTGHRRGCMHAIRSQNNSNGQLMEKLLTKTLIYVTMATGIRICITNACSANRTYKRGYGLCVISYNQRQSSYHSAFPSKTNKAVHACNATTATSPFQAGHIEQPKSLIEASSRASTVIMLVG
jgi:hypothetical protein